MVFSSITFICVFLPVIILLNRLIKDIKIKNILLIIASLLFYAYGEPIYVLLMIFCSFFNYRMALYITKNRTKKALAFTVTVDLLILGVFKYLSMLVSAVNLFGFSIKDPGIALPIGISFFTFQALSYVVDVYKESVEADENFLNILLYISFFPQLIAGPIVKYHDIDLEIKDRSVNRTDMAEGLQRFIFGLSKKVLLANTLGQTADYVYGLSNERLSAALVWIGAISYMLQIYFDFSGYSDMAIGLGRIFGFHFKENFDYPYTAESIQDFWRRWHISLTNWFREYVYIPLGGNRKGERRTWMNRLFIFFLTGLWHGANLTFILWGLYHGLFLALETKYPKFSKKLGKLSHLYVLVVVCVGFVLFRSDNVYQAFSMIGIMFTGFAMSSASISALYSVFTALFVITLICAFVFMTPVLSKKVTGKYAYIASIVLLLLSVISLAGSTYNPFIYFRF